MKSLAMGSWMVPSGSVWVMLTLFSSRETRGSCQPDRAAARSGSRSAVPGPAGLILLGAVLLGAIDPGTSLADPVAGESAAERRESGSAATGPNLPVMLRPCRPARTCCEAVHGGSRVEC